MRLDKFRQLEEILPSPNSYRTASGAPGHSYWQQRADYRIDVTIDDEKQRLIGAEDIHYHNNSPDTLRYLWVQLDANIFALQSHSNMIGREFDPDDADFRRMRGELEKLHFDGGIDLESVRDASGQPLAHTVVETMMRIDIPEPLAPGASVQFSIAWSYAINDAKALRARTGYEYFEEDGNYIYEIAQWFPRMAAYTDVNGWQNKQFLGRGEFTLEFGDYDVSITVPADHVVASTGVLQNPDDVLTAEQQQRLDSARDTTEPMFIVTPEEAKQNEKSKAKGTKTWRFVAKDVRDFAFATSRKFAWDAMLHDVEGKPVWAMSYFPNEGEPLWSRYSTHAIMHTLDVYSRYTIPYPYPVAISVNGPVGGMEYPMICFNGPRPEKDGTYTKRTKYGLISVIIHEVGHNYFPMIINSDERQWTWMDEGLNTFVQFLAQEEWEEKYPSRRGEARDIVKYMKSPNQVPIMTNSESILQFGNNAYGKPATALNILRESVLGRELFDFAFREYSRRWAFKRPQPADFFRTMEDASAVDLDWFWRGWFYTTDRVDVSLVQLRHYRMENGDPEHDKAVKRRLRDAEPESITKLRNKPLKRRVERFPGLLDFYNDYDDLDVTPQDREQFSKFLEELETRDKPVFEAADKHFYVLDLENIGGLVMPVILDVAFADGSTQSYRIPAEIWRKNAAGASKLFITDSEIESIVLDPRLETADTDLSNNHWPRKAIEGSFRSQPREKKKNPMQKAKEALEKTESDG
ncbi:MAG: M1 family metallopeptidase [Planctomycetota bacterium]